MFLFLFMKQDATTKILELMEGKPDLIIGNYTDGNLVSSLTASKLGVTQVHSKSPHLTCAFFPFYDHFELKLLCIHNK